MSRMMKLRKISVITAMLSAALIVGSLGGTASATPATPNAPAEVVETTLAPGEEQFSEGGGISARSANGCTAAPGNTGAMNCVYVNGSGTWVNYMRATMETGVSPWPQNLCDRGYEFQYYRKGYSTPVTKVFNQPGCTAISTVVTYSHTLQINADLEPGSTACTRTRNNHGFGAWSPYACVYILQ